MNPETITPTIIAHTLEEKLRTLDAEYRDELAGLYQAIDQANRRVREEKDATTLKLLRDKLI
jgi:hypothetical protein